MPKSFFLSIIGTTNIYDKHQRFLNSRKRPLDRTARRKEPKCQNLLVTLVYLHIHNQYYFKPSCIVSLDLAQMAQLVQGGALTAASNKTLSGTPRAASVSKSPVRIIILLENMRKNYWCVLSERTTES